MTIGGGMTAAARRRVGVTMIGEAAMIGIVEEGMGRPVGTEEEGVVGSRRGTARPSGARGLRSGMRQGGWWWRRWRWRWWWRRA